MELKVEILTTVVQEILAFIECLLYARLGLRRKVSIIKSKTTNFGPDKYGKAYFFYRELVFRFHVDILKSFPKYRMLFTSYMKIGYSRDFWSTFS